MADPLAKVDSFQYPSGHLGHLTESQQKSLHDFKALCQERGYYHPAASATELASHDDETLLRYLRARKFVASEAFKQFKGYEDWYKENHVEELYNTIDLEEYEAIRKLYPQWTGRRDRRGIPVYVFEVAHLDSKTVDNVQKMGSTHPTVSHKTGKLPAKSLRLIALYENLISFVMPLCSAIPDRVHPETPVSQSNNIVDISGVGLRQFWNLKNHMQDASQLATERYPETLDRIFIIGAPSFFPTVWGWVKRWFDPITVSKMFILSPSDMKSTLEKYIDPANIPKKYGGTLDFEFGQTPSLEPAIEKHLTFVGDKDYSVKGHKSIPTGPIRWRAGPDKTMEAFSVGSVKGVARNDKFLTIKHDIKDVYKTETENTAVDPRKLERVPTTDGTATHPKEEGDLYHGSELKSGQSTPAPGQIGEIIASPANSTAALPAKPDPTPEALPVSSSQPRQGTSDTRAAAQNQTHAAGQLEDGTPHLVDYGNHEKAATVEPSTVGQAPKDMDAKIPDVEEPVPGYVDQAKAVANQAYEATANAGSAVASSVMAVVGGKKAEPKVEAPSEAETAKAKAENERMAKVDDRNVEEFLRSMTATRTANATAEAISK